MEKKYRLNVGLMIVNQEGKVWMGERVNAEKFGFKYQMPQGGIDRKETPLEAAFRELYEETGLKKEHVDLLKESKDWHQYDFFSPIIYPEGVFHGQKQKWFLFRFKGNDSDFNLKIHPQEIEFSSYFWCEPDKMISLVVPFKRVVYQKVIKEFLPYF